jgi:hypothetical protein
LALESNETEFKFYTNGVLGSRGDIYIINFNRDSLSDRIDPGNFEINLKSLDGLSNNVMTFIDNSEDILESKFSSKKKFFRVNSSLIIFLILLFIVVFIVLYENK